MDCSLRRLPWARVVQGPVQFVLKTPLGTRMTVRKRVNEGFSDAAGYLFSRAETECIVDTRRGAATIPFDEITAAKAVPPPPRRALRYPPIMPFAAEDSGEC